MVAFLIGNFWILYAMRINAKLLVFLLANHALLDFSMQLNLRSCILCHRYINKTFQEYNRTLMIKLAIYVHIANNCKCNGLPLITSCKAV